MFHSFLLIKYNTHLPSWIFTVSDFTVNFMTFTKKIAVISHAICLHESLRWQFDYEKWPYVFQFWGNLQKVFSRCAIYSQELQKFTKQLFSNKKYAIYWSIKIVSQNLPELNLKVWKYVEKSTEKRTDLIQSLFSSKLSLFIFWYYYQISIY